MASSKQPSRPRIPAPHPATGAAEIATRLQQAISAFQAGRGADALGLLTHVLRHTPHHVEALLLAGRVAATQGHLTKAEGWLRHCLALAPTNYQAWDYLGNTLMAQGRPEEAEPCHREATRLAPDYAPAWYNLGAALHAMGRHQEAETAFRQTLAIAPHFIAAWIRLGTLLRERHDYPGAERLYHQLLRLRPDLHEARLNLGNVLRLQYRYPAARDHYQRLLQAVPGHPQALLSLALVALGEGDPAAALTLITQAQRGGRARPEELRHARVALFAHQRDLDVLREELLKAEMEGGIIPEYAHLLAETLVQHGLLAEAVDIWERLLARGINLPPGLLGALVRCQQRLCDWRGWQERVPQLIERIRAGDGSATTPFAALALPGLNPEDLRQVARAASHRYRGWLELGPLHAQVKRPDHDRLRIGYLSGDLREHATARLAVGVFELHDRQRFEIYAYALAPAEATSFGKRVVDAFDHFIPLHDLNPIPAAQRIANDGIDILVDLHGHTRLARPEILAQRPAPLQVAWLGFPGSMGAPFIDYLIADSWVIPPEEATYYDEALAYLPTCYQPVDHQRRSSPPPSRAQAGLPEDAFIFCCHNNAYKYTPETFATWCQLLAEVPGSLLWLLAPDDRIRANLRQAAHRCGLPPERLLFADLVPQEEHLARLGLADLFLDTWPYNAHTTASDALWAGLPVLTWPGQTFSARVATSLLHAVGLPELIAKDREDYLRRARRLAGDAVSLANLRHRLARARDQSPLFDTCGLTRALEDLYHHFWNRHQADLPAVTVWPPISATTGA